MESLEEEMEAKLSHMLRDIKELQKVLMHLRQGKKGGQEDLISQWLHIGREVSNSWRGYTSVEEIRDQREKRW